jgi:hypothetical protein
VPADPKAVEQGGAAAARWLTAQGYDQATAQGVIASLLAAGYPPQGWVRTLQHDFTPEELGELVESVQRTAAAAAAADPDGIEALPGEDDAAYAARQARVRSEASERMRTKFGGNSTFPRTLEGASGAPPASALAAAEAEEEDDADEEEDAETRVSGLREGIDTAMGSGAPPVPPTILHGV